MTVNGPVDLEPLGDSCPDQAPEGVQPHALELQVRVEAPPEATLVGFAVNVTVGSGFDPPTVTVTDWGALVPPDPLQLNVYVLVTVSAPVD